MSQAKVDKRKAEKANRTKEVKKNRIKKLLWKIIPSIILALLVFWLAFSGINKYQESKGREMVSADYSSVSDYTNSLGQGEEE